MPAVRKQQFPSASEKIIFSFSVFIEWKLWEYVFIKGIKSSKYNMFKMAIIIIVLSIKQQISFGLFRWDKLDSFFSPACSFVAGPDVSQMPHAEAPILNVAPDLLYN